MAKFAKVTSVEVKPRKERIKREIFVPAYLRAVKAGTSPEDIATAMGYEPSQLAARITSLNKEYAEGYEASGVPKDKQVFLPEPQFENSGKRGRKKAGLPDLMALIGEIGGLNGSVDDDDAE